MTNMKSETSAAVTNAANREAAGEPPATDAAEPAGAGPKKLGREDLEKVSGGGGFSSQTVTTVRVG
jgi:hypothetical protein